MRLKFMLGIEIALFLIMLVANGQGDPSFSSDDKAIVLVIDNSDSMDESDPEFNRTEIAKCYVKQMDSRKDKIGLVYYLHNAAPHKVELTSDSDFEKVYLELDYIKEHSTVENDTTIKDLIGLSNKLFDKANQNDKKIIVVFSDGKQGYPYNYEINKNITIITIGFGNDSKYLKNLKYLSDDHGGNFFSDSEARAIFCLENTFKLGDYVWNDLNGNGIQDLGEPGVYNVTVHLYDSTESSNKTTSTNKAGNYIFTGLVPGNYSVGFDLPTGYSFSPENQGYDDGLDSDANQSTRMTNLIILEPGDMNMSIDCGIFSIPGSIGDLVWNDTNGDGIQDPDESGVSGVEVKLLNDTDSELNSTSTDINGSYLFTNLQSGEYRVKFELLSGFWFSPMDQTDDENDSDADSTGMTDPIIIGPGDRNSSVDCGIVPIPPGSIGDLVWLDSNGNGIQDPGEDGAAGIEVKLTDAIGTEQDNITTNGTGYYEFTNLSSGEYRVKFELLSGFWFSPMDQTDDENDSDANSTGMTDPVIIGAGDRNMSVDCGIVPIPPGSIGDFVWNDSNGNGVQDPGESGVSGVEVKLLNDTDSEVNSTSTDVNGSYLFTNLRSGKYRVKFLLPSDFTFSPMDKTDDENDSDANQSTGITGPIYLVSGDTNLSVDCGIYGLGSIGDLVWKDSNGDGIQGLDGNGVPGILVSLINETGSETTLTDDSGRYLFTNLSIGEYRIKFEHPPGFEFSPQDQGSDDKIDSDANSTGMTDPIIIGPGDRNKSIDCGIKNVAPPNNTTVLVFAFDTSGSMKKYYRLAENESADIVSGWSAFENATVAIVSWDHESELLFGPAPLQGNEDRLAEILDNLSEKCIETDLTSYDQGLNGTLAALHDPATVPPNSSKIIIFLTGYSEFEPGEKLDDYISEANESGCKIFTIGIGINESFEASQNQYHNLTKISEATGGNFSSVAAFSSGDLNQTMKNISRELEGELAYNLAFAESEP